MKIRHDDDDGCLGFMTIDVSFYEVDASRLPSRSSSLIDSDGKGYMPLAPSPMTVQDVASGAEVQGYLCLWVVSSDIDPSCGGYKHRVEIDLSLGLVPITPCRLKVITKESRYSIPSSITSIVLSLLLDLLPYSARLTAGPPSSQHDMHCPVQIEWNPRHSPHRQPHRPTDNSRPNTGSHRPRCQSVQACIQDQ